MFLKKGTQVQIIAGKDKGKIGEVLRLIPKNKSALVQGVNMVKRHTRPTQASAGGITDIAGMLDADETTVQQAGDLAKSK